MFAGALKAVCSHILKRNFVVKNNTHGRIDHDLVTAFGRILKLINSVSNNLKAVFNLAQIGP